jgi:hypothetical protein
MLFLRREGWVSATTPVNGYFKGKKAAVAMVADVHHPPAGRTSTVEDVEFPQSVIGIRRPFVRHLADLHALVQSGECEATNAGYPKNPVFLATCRIVVRKPYPIRQV